MPYFAESPFTQIVDVHWKKKKPDDGPPGDTDPPYCGIYGVGATFTAPTDGDLVPRGANFIPAVGTYSTTKYDPVYGGMTPGKAEMLYPEDTITAVSAALYTTFVLLQGHDLLTSNAQLRDTPRRPGSNVASLNWSVPMASGKSPDGRAMVVRSYTISYEFSHTYHGMPGESTQYGFAISHPIDGVAHGPGAPLVVFDATGGSMSYTYDYKPYETFTFQNTPNAGNQFDPGLGGNAILWWMRYSPISGWTPDNAPGSIAESWRLDIIPNCQPMPNLFG